MSIFFDENQWLQQWQQSQRLITKVCSRCVYNNLTPSIKFDDQGVCNYCHDHDALCQQFPGGSQGEKAFNQIVDNIKQQGKRNQYDVVVGVSGGCDSSYLLHLAKEYGLRPLAVHYDNTWNSAIATQNIHSVLNKLDVPLWTKVVNNEEYDSLYKAILKAGVPDLEAPTDLGLAATLNMAASKHGIKTIFEGHSFRSEGISPLGWLYMDAKYIHSIYKEFGDGKRLKSYPYLWLSKQLKWMLVNQFKKVRPLWYLDYDKPSVKSMLEKDYGWQWYGGHHLENRMTAFYHTYFMPRRFGIDQRVNGFAAQIRSNMMSRKEALETLSEAPEVDMSLIEMILKRWQLTEADFIALMNLPQKRYTDFKTYKPTFERMSPFFYLMAKAEMIPWSFYMKYTKKQKEAA